MADEMVEWNGVMAVGMEWMVEWNGMVEWNEIVEWNSGMEWNGMELISCPVPTG